MHFFFAHKNIGVKTFPPCISPAKNFISNSLYKGMRNLNSKNDNAKCFAGISVNSKETAIALYFPTTKSDNAFLIKHEFFDFNLVKQKLLELSELFEIQAIGLDAFNCQGFANELQADGFDVYFVPYTKSLFLKHDAKYQRTGGQYSRICKNAIHYAFEVADKMQVVNK